MTDVKRPQVCPDKAPGVTTEESHGDYSQTRRDKKQGEVAGSPPDTH